MSEFSNQLKTRADIAQFIGEHVALRPGGNGFVGLCPFHSEKTPSFHVHTAKQFYYCFGCHAHGDVFEFLVQLKKLSFPEAVELVAERLGVPVPRASSEGDAERRDLLALHASAVSFFQKSLVGPAGVRARAYLAERELPPEAISTFALGFAPEDGRALVRHLQRAGFAPALALRAGLCQPRREHNLAGPHASGWNDLYDRFRDRLMFPIGDDRGRVVAFGGRLLVSGDVKAPKYLNSPETPLYAKGRVLYNLDRAKVAVRELGHAILVEGYFDCIRVFLAGFHNVVASCGTALTSAQITPLARMHKSIVLNFDPDNAGTAAAERSIGMLLEEGFQIRVVQLENQLDPDLFVRRYGREAYAAALQASPSFFEYLSSRVRQQFDLRRGEGKIAALNHLLPFLSQVHDPILRQNLAENCAASLGLDAPLLSQQLQHDARERRTQLSTTSLPSAEFLFAERVLLRAWIESEHVRAHWTETILAERLLAGLSLESTFDQLAEWSSQAETWTDILDRLAPEERHWIAQILLDDGPITDDVVEGAVAALRQRKRGIEVRQLQTQIQQAAASGDRARMQFLLRQKAEWDRLGRQSP